MSAWKSVRSLLFFGGDAMDRVRRVRNGACIVAAGLLMLFVASGFWFIDFQLGNGYMVQANVGTLRVGTLRAECPCDAETGAFNLTFTEGFDGLYGAAAWRPFHADNGYSDTIVLPLWQPLMATIAVAAFCQGYLRGRRHDPGVCRDCGYLLHGLPIIDSRRTCPECGRANYIGAERPNTPRVPEISRAA